MDDVSDRDLEARFGEIKRRLDEVIEIIRSARTASDEAAQAPDPPAEQPEDRRPRDGDGAIALSRRAKTSQVVKRVAIVSTQSGWLAWIDDHKEPLRLGKGKRPRALLQALAGKNGNHERDDGLVPVKSAPLLAKRVRDILKERKMPDPSAIKVHVLRLREFLKHDGFHPGLIETIGDGYRLRLIEGGQVTVNGVTVV